MGLIDYSINRLLIGKLQVAVTGWRSPVAGHKLQVAGGRSQVASWNLGFGAWDLPRSGPLC